MPDAPAITRALLAHYDAHRRDLPWRGTSDPYAVWVSEVMLQQTRVETVVPYWERWLERFPTVDALAEAPLDDVLKEWEGLGYYSRARNLHGAARMVRERFAGRVPEEVDGLRELPGVGEYTAGAVASIAFGIPAPAVDGNVRRVLARLYDLETPTPARLRDLAVALVPRDRPGDFNQALMELGATVCTPRSPSCEACPLGRWCMARRLGVQEERPSPAKRKAVPEETVETAILLNEDGSLLLVRRPEDGLLGGLWEFPGNDDGWAPMAAAILAETAHRDGAEPLATLDPVTHIFSHKRVTYLPTVWQVEGWEERGDGRGASADPGSSGPGERWAWAPPHGLDRYALPVAQQKIGASVRDWLAGGP